MLGQPVPDFSLGSAGGTPFRLSSAHGAKPVLYFQSERHPSRLHCPRRAIARLALRSHQRFQEKMRFPFELLSDPDEAVCRQFGVMKQKLMYGRKVRGIARSTFVIDAEGGLAREWRGVKVPGYAQEVLNFVKAL